MFSKKCTLMLPLALLAGLNAAQAYANGAPGLQVSPARNQSAPRPDALLAIDLNRSAVVEKIFASWAADIPSAQQAAFKSKLGALRADLLLAASLSPSVDGVLEIVHVSANNSLQSAPALGSAQTFYAAQSELKNSAVNSTLPAAQSRSFSSQSSENLSADKSKALGDANADLVYTPLVPCRLFDTRAGLTSALGTVGGTFANQQTKTITPAGACGIPTSGVASLFLSFHAYNNNPATLGVIGFMAPGTAFSALAATWTGGAWATGTYISRTNPNGSFDAFVGNNQPMSADMVVDVMGYFRAPNGGTSAGGGDITEVTTAAGSGLSGGVTSGAVTLSLANGYKLPQSCASGQVPKSDGAGNWACAADATVTVDAQVKLTP